jgi:hypothetical protein
MIACRNQLIAFRDRRIDTNRALQQLTERSESLLRDRRSVAIGVSIQIGRYSS